MVSNAARLAQNYRPIFYVDGRMVDGGWMDGWVSVYIPGPSSQTIWSLDVLVK